LTAVKVCVAGRQGGGETEAERDKTKGGGQDGKDELMTPISASSLSPSSDSGMPHRFLRSISSPSLFVEPVSNTARKTSVLELIYPDYYIPRASPDLLPPGQRGLGVPGRGVESLPLGSERGRAALFGFARSG